MSIYPVILCGGPGSRLWPASTAAEPKPFLDILGGHSLFQRTVLRMDRLKGARTPVIVTGTAHAPRVSEQLRAIGREGSIITEPVGRDSGPALLAAATWVKRADPTAAAVAVASDHHIPDDHAFAEAVSLALPAARDGEIVTFGVRPTYAATAYGYIRPGAPLGPSQAVFRVREFVEKPRRERAETLVVEGCLWNSGNFLFRPDVLLGEARRYAPQLVDEITRAVDSGRRSEKGLALGANFSASPRVSIDVAVMEKTRNAAVLPIEYAWSDLGAWDAVWSSLDRDETGTATLGVAAAFESRNCLLRAYPGSRILAVGAAELAIVARDGDVLVIALDRAGDLKTALAALESRAEPAAAPPADTDDVDFERLGASLRTWLWDKALPVWWCFGADHRRGGFHERLAADLAPEGTRRLRVQARQAYVYATAGAMGWPGPWEAAVAHGLDYLSRRYQRSDGLFRALVDENGAPLNEGACLYDQAFVLLALAAAAKALPLRRAEFEAQAERLATAVRRVFAASGRGFHADERSAERLSDPVMHLFEAVLAWVEVGGAAEWRYWALDIITLFFERMVDAASGRVYEVYDEEWRPHPAAEQRYLEPGHHFEWAWLLERWSRLAHDTSAHRLATTLFSAGERGVDPFTGLVWDEVTEDFSVLTRTSRLWPQTERLKAALILAGTAAVGSCFHQAARAAARAVERYLDTPVGGLWRDSARTDAASADDPAPASSFYHIVGAIAAFAGPAN